MKKIVGIDGMTVGQVHEAVARGGRFVVYQYCISILVMSFRRSSEIHFVPAGTSAAGKGVQFTLLSLFGGWWGFPWGPIWTISTIAKNLGGGVDVTQAVLASVAPQPAGAIRPAPRA